MTALPHVAYECLPFRDEPRACDLCGTQLTNRQTRWCSGKCSHIFYLSHIWAHARQNALVDADRKCAVCGTDQALEVDHISERNGLPMATHSCLHHPENLRVLCHHHHVNRNDIDVAV